MESAVLLKGIYKNYRDFKLGPINLEINKGYITAVIGRNGAGKTTLLKGIAGIEPFSKGTVTIAGIDEKSDLEINDNLAYVSDKVNMYSDFTCEQVIKFVSCFYKNWDKTFEEKLIEIFQIPLQKKLYELSKGMKVKLNLLLSFPFQPNILLLDEPTVGLDSIVRKQFLDLILQFIENEERTVVISSHITTDIEHIADYLVFIKDGKVVLQGEKEFFLDDLRLVSVPLSSSVDLDLFAGYERTSSSFVGIVRKKDLHLVQIAKFEIPTVDQILLYVVEGGVQSC